MAIKKLKCIWKVAVVVYLLLPFRNSPGRTTTQSVVRIVDNPDKTRTGNLPVTSLGRRDRYISPCALTEHHAM
jgi:hypothetical protein